MLAEMKQELVGSATKQIAKIQQGLSARARIFIGSGDVPKVIRQAGEEAPTDVIAVGRDVSHGGRWALRRTASSGNHEFLS